MEETSCIHIQDPQQHKYLAININPRKYHRENPRDQDTTNKYNNNRNKPNIQRNENF